jgi:hypothetical protein
MSELIYGAWNQAKATGSVGKLSVAALTGLMICGVSTAAGWSLLGRTPGETSPPTAVHEADREKTPLDWKLRAYLDQVNPRVLSALQQVAVGEGSVELQSAEDDDFGLYCVYAIHHRTVSGKPWVSYLSIRYATASQNVWAHLDLFGDGNWRGINIFTPLVAFPDTKWETAFREWPALFEAMRQFTRIPRNEQTVLEETRNRQRIVEAFTPHVGEWFLNGDPSQKCEIRIRDGVPYFRDPDGPSAGHVNELWRFRLANDNQVQILRLNNSPAVFSADGQKLDFPQTGVFWTRKPLNSVIDQKQQTPK